MIRLRNIRNHTGHFSHVARFHTYSNGPWSWCFIHHLQKENCRTKNAIPANRLAVMPKSSCKEKPQLYV